jgi:hypothetical protein
MNLQIRDQTVDLVVVGVANLMNIIMVFVFILRTRRIQHPLIVGIAWGAFILVLFAAVLLNIRAERAWWTIVIPLLLALFLLFELALDYAFKIEFRSTWLLGPYLLMYYASIMGMIGYAFHEPNRGALFLCQCRSWLSCCHEYFAFHYPALIKERTACSVLIDLTSYSSSGLFWFNSF